MLLHPNWVWALSCGILPAGQIYDGGREAIRLETARNEASRNCGLAGAPMSHDQGKGKTDSRRLRFRAAPALSSPQGDGTGNLSYAVRSVRNRGPGSCSALNHPDGAVLRQMAGAEETPVCREGYTP